MSKRYIVIMAGGNGERFWPQSRHDRPKHLLPIAGGTSMLAQTLARLGTVVPPENIRIITRRDQCSAVLEACPTLKPAQVTGEPVGRDTAAAVALATLLIGREDPDASLALLPADALIHDADGFRKTLTAAFAVAEDRAGDNLVTIGIPPVSPATGYGYIHRGAPAGPAHGHAVFQVRRFVEKPDAATAQTYLESGGYFWNAGMFVWKVTAIRRAFEKHEPEVWNGILALGARLDAGERLDVAMDAVYPALKKISIDYAVLEKADNVLCLPAAFDWDDAGEWSALARHEEKDASGNVRLGETSVLDAGNNIIVSSDGHLIAALGVEDLIIVHTADATLVCPKHRAQEIKKLVRQIAERNDGARFV
ncbi:MAG: NTP transferase domain-containing protein [Puniceicoccales bacterium]|jgi:mannose-1-phosphate guanylyltransferase|nr:NTP transferase domain-containing protein [Puniceicoccales bacterium]